jgi:prevent-host-death family protein
MKVVSALDVRARFGQIVDEAAAGERIVVERAGNPVAAIVPLADLEALEPGEIRARQRLAFAALRARVRAASRVPTAGVGTDRSFDATAFIRADRDRGHRP